MKRPRTAILVVTLSVVTVILGMVLPTAFIVNHDRGRIRLTNHSRIKNGMSYWEVLRILQGPPGTYTTRSPLHKLPGGKLNDFVNGMEVIAGRIEVWTNDDVSIAVGFDRRMKVFYKSVRYRKPRINLGNNGILDILQKCFRGIEW